MPARCGCTLKTLAVTSSISSDAPIIRDLAPGRWRVSRSLSDARVGRVLLIGAGGRDLLDVQLEEFNGRDHVVAHAGGAVALFTIPRIPSRKPPNVTLSLEEI
jgi:hypothetical protein